MLLTRRPSPPPDDAPGVTPPPLPAQPSSPENGRGAPIRPSVAPSRESPTSLPAGGGAQTHSSPRPSVHGRSAHAKTKTTSLTVRPVASDPEAAPEDIHVAMARVLMRKCYEAGLISQQEAVSLVPSSEELASRSILAAVADKIGEKSVPVFQRKICGKLRIPVFSHQSFPPAKKVPANLLAELRVARMIPLAYEHSPDGGQRRHGFLTVAAECPAIEQMALVIALKAGIPLLLAQVVVYEYEGFSLPPG